MRLGAHIRTERRSVYREKVPLPAWLDFCACLMVATVIVCCVHVGIYLWRTPLPQETYVEVNHGFPLTGDVHLRLGPGVIATTQAVGAKQIVVIERTEP